MYLSQKLIKYDTSFSCLENQYTNSTLTSFPNRVFTNDQKVGSINNDKISKCHNKEQIRTQSSLTSLLESKFLIQAVETFTKDRMERRYLQEIEILSQELEWLKRFIFECNSARAKEIMILKRKIYDLIKEKEINSIRSHLPKFTKLNKRQLHELVNDNDDDYEDSCNVSSIINEFGDNNSFNDDSEFQANETDDEYDHAFGSFI